MRINKRRLAQGVVLLLVTSAVCFLLLETAYRVRLFGWSGLSYEKMNSLRYMGNSDLLRPSQYPEVVFELKPGLHTYFKMALLETNSFGLRDKEYSLSKPANTFRVAVIGDSFTMPSGVTIEEAYHTLIENRLNDEGRGVRYEFVNFAVAGYCLRQYLAVAEHRATVFDPDLILIGFCEATDYRMLPEEIYDEPYRARKKSYAFFRPHVIRRLKTALGMTQRKGLEQGMGGSLPGEEEMDHVSQICSLFGEFSKTHDIPIVVAHLALSPKECEALKEVVTSNGLHFVDVSKAFEGRVALNYTIRPVDYGHPNAEGHKIFAEVVYNYLNDMGLLDTKGTR